MYIYASPISSYNPLDWDHTQNLPEFNWPDPNRLGGTLAEADVGWQFEASLDVWTSQGWVHGLGTRKVFVDV